MREKYTILSIFSIFFISLLFAAGCSKPTNGSDTPSVTLSEETTEVTEPSYMVIPLTSGEVSPISACSYDLLHTVSTIQIYDSTDYNILNGCFAIIDKYEKLFSRTLKESEVYRINHSDSNTVTISEELADILKLSLYYGEKTNGAFDISIAPLSSLWDFSSPEHRTSAPAVEDIEAACALINYADVSLNENTLTFAKNGMQLELGAVAKGYIADRVKDYLLENGVTSAIINLGGNVLLVGEKPDGSAFNVGIQKPFEDRNSVVVAISELRDVSMVSSGIYERYFYDIDGTFYHHILNPDTGYPCDTDLLQVTIISPDSATGDALSTSCFALGLEKGMELIHSLDNVYAVFMTMDGELHFSNGYLENIPTRIE